MKRKIEDYINQKVAIECETKEQWQKIIDFSKIRLINKFDLSSNKCINLNTIAWGRSSKEDIIKQGYTIYPASDFLEEESKFEERKWYKRNTISNSKGYLMYVKSLEINIKDNTQVYKERINGDGEYINLEKNSSCTFKNFTLLTDLLEIQEFLPPNHPDLIIKEIIPEYVEYIDTKYKGKIVKVEDWKCGSYCKVIFYNGIKEQPFKHLVKPSTKEVYEAQNEPKQLTVKNLIKGEIYVFDISNTKNFISKFDYSDSLNYYDSYYIQGDEFNDEPESALISSISNLRLATPEEKKWLKICIKQAKFISKEDLHLYDDNGLLIKKEETMFKQGDYIVNLKREHSQFKINHIFKQKYNLERISPEIDCMGSTCNSWLAIRYINQSDWRYATPEEITEYEKIGKPFDVNILCKKEESLLGRWVKRIINGEYLLITSYDRKGECYVNNTPISIDLHYNNQPTKIKKAYELMPIEFQPKEKEWIPQPGEWVWNIKKEYSNVRPNPCQITKIDMANKVWCKDFENESYLNMNEFSKKYRKALPNEIPNFIDNIEKTGIFPITPMFELKPFTLDIEISPIIKKTKQLQTITIESPIHLELNLTKIKSKQIQTIKI